VRSTLNPDPLLALGQASRFALNADGTSALPALTFLTSAGTRDNVRSPSKYSSFQMRLGVPH